MTLLVCAVVAHCAPIASLSSFAGVFQERDALTVTGEWTMGRESALSVSGRAVSSAGFDDSKWLPAKVPGTVLDNMVRNGLLPDPYYGINNRRKLKTIPDLNDVEPEYYTPQRASTTAARYGSTDRPSARRPACSGGRCST